MSDETKRPDPETGAPSRETPRRRPTFPVVPGPWPSTEVLPSLPGEPATGPGQREDLEPVYRTTVAGLRRLGHDGAADVLEREQFLIHGNPNAPQPLGTLSAPTLMGFPVREAAPGVLPDVGDVVFGSFDLYDRRQE